MSAFDGRSVLRDLERGDCWVDKIDTVRLIELAGFVLAEEEGTHRIFKHAASGERLFLNMKMDVPPGVGPVLADKIKNYWP